MKRFKNIFTSFIGLALIGFCGYAIYKNKATWSECSGFITIGIALLFSDDEQFAKNFLPFIFKDKKSDSNDSVNPNEGNN